MPYSSYKELNVWKTSIELSKAIYQLTSTFPSEEKFILAAQMKRAVISIPSNIAEGYRQKTTVNQLRYAQIAYGSATDLETQLILVKELKLTNSYYQETVIILDKTLRLLNGYCQYLSSKTNNATTQQTPDATNQRTFLQASI